MEKLKRKELTIDELNNPFIGPDDSKVAQEATPTIDFITKEARDSLAKAKQTFEEEAKKHDFLKAAKEIKARAKKVKVNNPNLQKMHLSESLFDAENDKDCLQRQLKESMARVRANALKEGYSRTEVDSMLFNSLKALKKEK